MSGLPPPRPPTISAALRDPVAGMQSALLQVAADAGDERDLVVGSRLPSSTAIGLGLLAQLVDQLPHYAGVGARRFGDDDVRTPSTSTASASSLSADRSPPTWRVGELLFQLADFLGQRGHARRHFGGRNLQ